MLITKIYTYFKLMSVNPAGIYKSDNEIKKQKKHK